MSDIRYLRHEIVFCVWVTMISLGLIMGVRGAAQLASTLNSSGKNEDMLAYTTIDFHTKRLLMLYDLHHRVSVPLLTNIDFSRFALSRDGRLAYPSADEGNWEIYVLDTRLADRSPVNISQTPDSDEFPLTWSPDGRYLAFESETEKNGLIYVWDGETAVNITPNDLENTVSSYWESWNFDGQLTFIAWIDFLSGIGGIYLWDGISTFNLGQYRNRYSRNNRPVWNAKGQLVFMSEGNVIEWDGATFKNGAPNFDILNVPHELISQDSYPTWTTNGELAFSTQMAEDSHSQIYVWDGHTATNISQNSGENNGSATWSSDGYWSFSAFSSLRQSVYIRDANNRTVLTVEGLWPTWSSSGYLMFCTWKESRWVLSVWDSKRVSQIAQASAGIYAHSNSGSRIVCSS